MRRTGKKFDKNSPKIYNFEINELESIIREFRSIFIMISREFLVHPWIHCIYSLVLKAPAENWSLYSWLNLMFAEHHIKENLSLIIEYADDKNFIIYKALTSKLKPFLLCSFIETCDKRVSPLFW